MKINNNIQEVNEIDDGIILPEPFKDDIPKQLKAIPRWALWEYHFNEKESHYEMEFFNPIKCVEASVNNPSTWMNYEDCLHFYKKLRFTDTRDGCEGVGFLHLPDDQFRIFNFNSRLNDCCYEDSLRYDNYREGLESYSERFKDDINIFLKAAPISYDFKDDFFKVIKPGQFFPMSGRRLNPFDIEDLQAESLLVYDAAKIGDFLPETRTLYSSINYMESEIKSAKDWHRFDPVYFDKAIKSWENKLERVKRLKPQNRKAQSYFFYLKNRKSFKCTDTGNGERLVKQYYEKIRYCHPWKNWLIWNRKFWQPDDSAKIKWFAKVVVRRIYLEGSNVVNDDIRRNIVKWGQKSEAEERKNAMIKSAQSEIGIPIEPKDLDSDPWLLNVQNGVLNLKAGVLLPHHPGYFITKMAPVIYDPHATAPKWEEFLNTIFDGNKNLIDFIKRAVGYSLTGKVTEQCLFFLYGGGANGKSTFIETLRWVLGNYAMQSDFNTFLKKGNDSIRNDLARLKGARFVSAVEAGQDKTFSETVIKQVSGGDTILTRFLYKEFFEFKPEFKIFLAANHKPIISGTDHAIWRRIKLIPFDVTIPEKKQNKKLLQDLQSEAAGILNWAIEGCRDWQIEGLGEPDEIRTATLEYRDEMDGFKRFKTDCCNLNTQAKTPVKELYDRYKNYCYTNGDKPMGKIAFGRRIRQLGCEQHPAKINGESMRAWFGIGLKDSSNYSAGLKSVK